MYPNTISPADIGAMRISWMEFMKRPWNSELLHSPYDESMTWSMMSPGIRNSA